MRRNGFTLIEVMVAIVIFALAAGLLGGAYLNVLTAYDVVSRSNQRDEDLRFARAQLLAETDRDTAEKGDDFETPDGRRARWHATIETSDLADLFRVTFVCEFSALGTEATPPPVTETFMLLRPTWADPTENGKLRQESKNRIAEVMEQQPTVIR